MSVEIYDFNGKSWRLTGCKAEYHCDVRISLSLFEIHQMKNGDLSWSKVIEENCREIERKLCMSPIIDARG